MSTLGQLLRAKHSTDRFSTWDGRAKKTCRPWRGSGRSGTPCFPGLTPPGYFLSPCGLEAERPRAGATRIARGCSGRDAAGADGSLLAAPAAEVLIEALKRAGHDLTSIKGSGEPLSARGERADRDVVSVWISE
jgi:hypothetical protein